MKDSIFERVLKTFYQCFIATFVASLAFADNFEISTVKAITISCFASSLSGAMNYYFRYLDLKKGDSKDEQNFLESSCNSSNKNNVRGSFSDDWDKHIR